MNHLLNIMRMQAQAVNGTTAQTRIGTVSAYDPNNYSAKVLFQPDNTESGWLPVFSPWVGNGWGLFCPPTIGDMVKVHFQEGNHEAGIVAMRGYNDSDRPLPTPSGEFWLVHSSGSFLKFKNDGSVQLHSAGNLAATVGGNLSATITGTCTASAASWAITGNVNVTGNIVASGNITDHQSSLDSMRGTYNSHTHPDPQGSSTGVPNQAM